MSLKVTLKKGKGFRVEAGHPWIYDNELEPQTGDLWDGAIVDIYNYKGWFIGRGFYNSKSQIRVRILTRNEAEEIDQAFFDRKIEAANSLRTAAGFTENYRVVFGEADGLPSLVIDKFKDVLVLQILTLGMERWKPMIQQTLERLFQPSGMYERNDVPVRVLEGLTEYKGVLQGNFPTRFIIQEPDEVQFYVDIENGQKTGFFLDQKMNRQSIKPYVQNKEVLDCFCYSGSFSLYAARYGAKHVLGLDISEDAIQQARQNAALNQLTNVSFEVKNTFDALTGFYKEQKRFDTIILDPPAFTKSRGNIENALKGYKEINLKALKLLRPGGILITCTCSHFITPEHFRDVIEEASIDAGLTIRQMHYQIQSPDHPYIWGIEETLYLKFYILQVVSA